MVPCSKSTRVPPIPGISSVTANPSSGFQAAVMPPPAACAPVAGEYQMRSPYGWSKSWYPPANDPFGTDP